jgi:coenzyme F420 hydrogenase subunit beta
MLSSVSLDSKRDEQLSSVVVKGPRELQKNVLAKGLCSACGACTNLCPYIDMVKGRAVLIEPCGLSEGKCYDFCPRAYVDVPSLDRLVFGSYRRDLALGSNISVMKARAKESEVRSTAQYGGVVSALVTYALETGEIDAAVLAKSQDKISAEPTIARNRKDVFECAGSKYIVCPTVAEVLEATKQVKGKIGVVGTSCQITAVRKMQASNFEVEADKIGLLIGLFCTWAVSPDAYGYIRDLVGSAKVMKIDVPPPPANIFVIQTEAKRIEVPLDEVRKFIMPACNVCFDMTNELADISVGTVEGEEDWNTVIVRTKKGEKILQGAIDAGIIETNPLEKDRLKHLCEASLTRKRRVLTETEPEEIAYLTIREEDKSKIIS